MDKGTKEKSVGYKFILKNVQIKYGTFPSFISFFYFMTYYWDANTTVLSENISL